MNFIYVEKNVGFYMRKGDYDCTDKEILDVLSYYSITRDIAEQSI